MSEDGAAYSPRVLPHYRSGITRGYAWCASAGSVSNFCPLFLCDLPPFVHLSPFIEMFSPTVPGGDTPYLIAGDARAERGRTRG